MGAPASTADVKLLEGKIGLQLPRDVKESYLVYDGSKGSAIFPNGYYLLTLAEIAKEHAIWTELLRKKSFAKSIAKPSGPIKLAWWNEKWIPVTASGGGDHDCIDMDPAPGGSIGQVIEFSHETGPLRVQSKSFSAWLTNFANDLKNGKYRYDDDSLTLLPIE